MSSDDEDVDRSAYKIKVTLASGKKIKLESAIPFEEYLEIQKQNGDLFSGSSQSASEPSQVIAWKKHEIENYSDYLNNPKIWTTPNLNNPWHFPSHNIFREGVNYGPCQVSLLTKFKAGLSGQRGSGVDSMTQFKDLPFNLPNSNSPNSWLKQWIGNQKVKAGSETYCIRKVGGVDRIHLEKSKAYTCETKGCLSRVPKAESTCFIHKGSHTFFGATVFVEESGSQNTARYFVHSCQFKANPDATEEERISIMDNVNKHLYSTRLGDFATAPKHAFIISEDRLEVLKFLCSWTYAIFLASMQPEVLDRPKISFYDIQRGGAINIYLPNLCEEQMAKILRDYFNLELQVKRLSMTDWVAAEWPSELGLQVSKSEETANHANGNIYIMEDMNVIYGGLNLSGCSKSFVKEQTTNSSPNLYQNAFSTKLYTRAIIIPAPLQDPQVDWTPEDKTKLEKEMEKAKCSGTRRASVEARKMEKILGAKKQIVLKPLYEKVLRKSESILIFSLQNLALFQLPHPDRTPLSVNLELNTEETPNFTNVNKQCQFQISEINSNLFAISNAYCKFMTGFFFELVQIN